MKSRTAFPLGRALWLFWSLLFLLCPPMNAGQFSRTDFHVLTSDGFQIAVREIKLLTNEGAKTPSIILVHGARVPGIASFDLTVPGGSLAEDLAKAGFATYVMDARGYGSSTRLKAMDLPPEETRPLSRAYEVVRDIAAVVREVQHRNSTNQVALFGWATGALWCGMYTSQYPETVSHLILLNGLYGGSTEHPMLGHGSSSEDPQHPGRFNEKAIGAYSTADAHSLIARWDISIPEPGFLNRISHCGEIPQLLRLIKRRRWPATPLPLHAIRRVCALPTAHWKIAFIRRSAGNCTTVPRFWPVC